MAWQSQYRSNLINVCTDAAGPPTATMLTEYRTANYGKHKALIFQQLHRNIHDTVPLHKVHYFMRSLCLSDCLHLWSPLRIERSLLKWLQDLHFLFRFVSPQQKHNIENIIINGTECQDRYLLTSTVFDILMPKYIQRIWWPNNTVIQEVHCCF